MTDTPLFLALVDYYAALDPSFDDGAMMSETIDTLDNLSARTYSWEN